MAIRVSMGATRWVLIRLLLVESLLLAFGGAALGCLFGYAAIKGVAAIVPQGTIPSEVVIRMNVPLLLFSLAVGMMTAVVFGLMPALQTVQRNMMDPLKDAGRVLGYVTSATYGYSVGQSLAYGYLPVAYAAPGTAVEIEYFGQRHAATVTPEPLFDPRGDRIRA